MAFKTKKISQMDPKGSNLASTDLLEISELVSGSYVTKSITGAEIIASVPPTTVDWGDIGGTLSAQTDLNTALSGKVPTTRTLTINGTTQDLSADRTFTVSTGITIGTTAITSGTVGRVLFEGTGNVVQESANLFWDNTNGRLGINNSSPQNTIDLVGSRLRHNGTTSATQVSTLYELNDSSNANSTYILFGVDTTGGIVGSGVSGTYLSCGKSGSATSRDLNIHNYANNNVNFWTNNAQRLRIFGNGNIGINTTTDAGFKLDVNGTARLNANSGNDIISDTNVTINGYAGGGSVIRFQSRNAAATLLYKFTIPNQSNLAGIFNGGLRFTNLPTSPAGLSTGDVWNNLGILTIV